MRLLLFTILAVLLGCDQQHTEPKASEPDSSAQLNLYEAGRAAYARGDFSEAARLYQKAIDGQWTITNIFAAGNLGQQYLVGKGVRQDYVEAAKWIRKSAESGGGIAQLNLGIMYMNGQGLPMDNVQAHKWLNLAAAHLSNQTAGEDAIGFRNVAASKMTAAQLAEAQRLAREWKRKCWDGSVAPEGGLC